MISLEGVEEDTLPPSIYTSGKLPPTQTRNGLEDKAPPRKKNEDLKKCTLRWTIRYAHRMIYERLVRYAQHYAHRMINACSVHYDLRMFR